MEPKKLGRKPRIQPPTEIPELELQALFFGLLEMGTRVSVLQRDARRSGATGIQDDVRFLQKLMVDLVQHNETRKAVLGPQQTTVMGRDWLTLELQESLQIALERDVPTAEDPQMEFTDVVMDVLKRHNCDPPNSADFVEKLDEIFGDSGVERRFKRFVPKILKLWAESTGRAWNTSEGALRLKRNLMAVAAENDVAESVGLLSMFRWVLKVLHVDREGGRPIMREFELWLNEPESPEVPPPPPRPSKGRGRPRTKL